MKSLLFYSLLIITIVANAAAPVGIVEGDYVADIASGTETWSSPVAITGKLIKKGAGTLVLSAENEIGGISSIGGVISAEAQGCLGTGTISMDGGRIQFNAANAIVSNPITATTSSAPSVNDGTTVHSTLSQLFFLKNTTLTGGITTPNISMNINCDRMSKSAYYDGWCTATFNCEVNVGTANLVMPNNGAYGKYIFKQKVTCNKLDMGNAWSAAASITFEAENAIQQFPINSVRTYVKHPDALKTAQVSFIRCWEAGRGIIYAQTEKMVFRTLSAETSVTSADYYPSGSTKTGAQIVPYSPVTQCTIEIIGDMNGTFTTYARINNGVNLKINTSANSSYKQVFNHVPSTMNGTLSVLGGTLEVINGAGFPNATALVLDGGAKFVCNVTNGVCLASVGSINMGPKSVIQIMETAPYPLGTYNVNMVMSADAQLQCPASSVLKFKSLTIGGVDKPNGRYENVPGFPAGMRVDVCANPGTNVNWTDAAEDHLMSNAGNWNEDFSIGELQLGTLNVLVGDNGTEMAPADEVELLSLRSTRASTQGPFVIGAVDKTITVYNQMSLKSGVQNILRGTIATPNHQDQGEPSNGGTYTLDCTVLELTKEGYINNEVGYRAGMVPLVLDGVTIEKPVYVYAPKPGTPTFWAKAGTRNEIKGALLTDSGHTYIYVDKDAELKVSGGWKFTNFPTIYSNGKLLIYDKPLNSTTYITVDGGNLVLDAENCVLGGSASGEGVDIRSGTLEFKRSYCLNGRSSLLQRTGVTSSIEFNSTIQRVYRLHAVSTASRSVMHGDLGSQIEILGGRDNMALTACKELVSSVQTTGGLSYKMSAEGDTFRLTGKSFESAGDIEVTAGTILFDESASWLNGTNVVMSGTGTLRISKSRTFGNQAIMHFSGEGKLEIGQDKVQKVAECRVNGVQLEAGTYVANNLTEGDALYGHLVSGTLRVGRFGGTLIIR